MTVSNAISTNILNLASMAFLSLGSNGESVYLEHSEKLKLIEAARRRIPSSMTLLAGTGVESTQATIDLTKEAADRGVDAVLVKNPFYLQEPDDVRCLHGALHGRRRCIAHSRHRLQRAGVYRRSPRVEAGH